MKNDRNSLIGLVILSIGLVLLIVTFYIAFLYLVGELPIVTHLGLVEPLGEILGPIAEAAMRIIFLVVMVWIGSSLTKRGVQLLLAKKEQPVFQ